MKKLFKWPGGKSRELKLITKMLPQDINCVVEPFAGSAALSFYLEMPAVLNDLDKHIINLYNVIANHSDYIKLSNMIKAAKTLPFIKKDDPLRGKVYSLEDEYYKQRIALNDNNTSPLNSAYAFLIVRQLCFSGMLRNNPKNGNCNVPYGWYKTFTNNLSDDAHMFLNQSQITQSDYKNCIKQNDKPGHFIFIDPPYRNKAGYPAEEWNDQMHKDLLQTVKGIKHANWMIVHCDDTFYRKGYKDFYINEHDYSYGLEFKGRNKAKRKIKHLYITNYEVGNV